MTIENLLVFGSFLTIDLNNNNSNNNKVAIWYARRDYKLLCGSNLKIWGMKCIRVHYPVPVLVRCLI